MISVCDILTRYQNALIISSRLQRADIRLIRATFNLRIGLAIGKRAINFLPANISKMKKLPAIAIYRNRETGHRIGRRNRGGHPLGGAIRPSFPPNTMKISRREEAGRTAYFGINYLRARLEQKRHRVETRYRYYEMKNHTIDFNISSPPDLRFWNACVGWCAKGVDALADRLVFRSFANDNFDFNGIFAMNNRDILLDSAMLSALIASCCFVYISEDDTGYPRLQVIDAANATGDLNTITGLLNEGYAVLKRDQYGVVDTSAYFTRESTVILRAGQKPVEYPNKAPWPLLVPIVYRPDAVRPFGHSRISRACMSLTGSALRTIKRSEISAEFYSYPQKYVLGTSPEQEPMEKWRASMSSLLELTKDEDGDKPSVGQFTQQSMQPHTDQLRMFASLFAGETGLTLDDLGFATENPSSAEAIKASHENLRLTARKAQRTFGSGLLNVGYLAACVRDNFKYHRQQIYLTHPRWEPIFEPDAAMMSSIGDGVNKINQAVPGYFGAENLRDLTGVEAEV